MARARIKDVARVAGVSVGTVSHVLNHPERVSAKVTERVLETMDELGFIRNATAGELRKGKSSVVGVGVLDLSNPFFAEAAVAIEDRLRQDDCVIMLSSSRANVKEERKLLRLLEEQQVRGILLTPASSDLSLVHKIHQRGTRIVLMDYASKSQHISSVAVDDEKGAFLAIEHLFSLGHKRIAFINGPKHLHQARSRARGVRRAFQTYGVDEEHFLEIECVAFDAKSGEIGARKAINSGNASAFFCANDLLALGTLNALRTQGISVPKDVSVVGFDDISVAKQFYTPLTTIRQPMRELGWTAADLLLDANESARHILLGPKLIVRESTSPPIE